MKTIHSICFEDGFCCTPHIWYTAFVTCQTVLIICPWCIAIMTKRFQILFGIWFRTDFGWDFCANMPRAPLMRWNGFRIRFRFLRFWLGLRFTLPFPSAGWPRSRYHLFSFGDDFDKISFFQEFLPSFPEIQFKFFQHLLIMKRWTPQLRYRFQIS